MSSGESLILIAVVSGLGYLVYHIHRKKKWKLLLKIAGVLVLIGIIIAASVFAYFWYINRPHEANKLGKISLGMSPVDVTLQLGKPSAELVDDDGGKRFVYSGYSAIDYLIKFENDSVAFVCTYQYLNEVFGLGVYDSEEKVLKKLGSPSNTSINKEGLTKFISYDKYKVSFGIERGEVDSVCVTKSGKVSFAEEY